MANKIELFINGDVEADGRVPGLSSMLSFGCAAFDIDKNFYGSFSRNLELLAGANPEPDTTKFWDENPQAYAATRTNIVDPKQAMEEFVAWLKGFKKPVVFVGYPASYDFKWFDYYTVRFTGNNPFGFSRCIDVKSYAYGTLKRSNFMGTSKKAFKREWFDDLPHTHIAEDDAIEQGAMWINILRDNLGLERLPDFKRS
jgi:hypothetical protein